MYRTATPLAGRATRLSRPPVGGNYYNEAVRRPKYGDERRPRHIWPYGSTFLGPRPTHFMLGAPLPSACLSPPRTCSTGVHLTLTLLMVMRAGDGIAAVSDRKESMPDRPGREVSKYHLDAGGRFYISLSGDALTAAAILDHAATFKIADIDRMVRDIEAVIRDKHRRRPHVDGIIALADTGKTKLYDIYIRDGRVDAFANSDATSVHGDYAANVLCRHLTKNLDVRSLSCDAAAAHLHVLASSVAETVDSVGTRDEYGFDLVLMETAGGTCLLERQTTTRGTLKVQFLMANAVRRGGRGVAHE